MKFLTPLILLLILTGISAYVYIHREEIISPCLPPLHYTIGTVDPQFRITRERFTDLVSQAEYLWEKALGKDVFVSDPNASFTINLVYDERQSKTDQGLRLESEIDAQKKTYDQMTQTLDKTKKSYADVFSQYQSQLAEYQKELEQYNKSVSDWNQKGGAPEKEYKKLESERSSLETKREAINALAEKVNSLANSSQKIATTINSTVDTINNQVQTHNTLFEDGKEFDKGRFNGKNITIYQFVTADDLLLALTHELGHALFIEHTDDPRSIMYFLLKEQPSNPVMIAKKDLEAANTSCRFTIQTPQEYFNLLISSLSSALNQQKAN